MVLTAAAAMPRDGERVSSLAELAVILAVVTGVCLTLWALAGSAIADWIMRPSARRWLDRAMGGFLIASAALLLA